MRISNLLENYDGPKKNPKSMLVAEFPSQEIQENFCQDPGLKAALSRVAVEKLEEATAQQVHQLGASWDPIFVGVLGSIYSIK